MHERHYQKAVEHDFGLSRVLTKQGSDLLYCLEGVLYDILSLLDDSLTAHCRTCDVLEHRTKQAS